MNTYKKNYSKRLLNVIPKLLYLFIKNQNLHNTDSIYFSNRAVAYKLLNRFNESKQDALYAIKLDEKNSRAHFIYGTIILLEVQMNPEFSE